MILRINGITEIKNRLIAKQTELGLTTIRMLPDVGIDKGGLPAIIIKEGVDEIDNRNPRTYTGYPAKRDLEVIVESWVTVETDIRAFHQQVRSVVLADPAIDSNTRIREARSIGPFNMDIPDIWGMQLVLSMFYRDQGLDEI